MVLIGPNGLGKTMLLKNLAHQAILHGHSARFTLASDMLQPTSSPHAAFLVTGCRFNHAS